MSSNPVCHDSKGNEKATSDNGMLFKKTVSNVPFDKDPDLQAVRAHWKVQEYHEITKAEFKSPLGKNLIYSFAQGNIPIVGMEIRLRVDLDGTIHEEENTYQPIPQISVNEKEVESQVAQLSQGQEGRFEIQEVNS